MGDAQELSPVVALKSAVQDLQNRLAVELVVIASKETKISDLEKDISDRARVHESIIFDRDEIIASLRKKVSELKTEVNNLLESRRLAQETAAQLTIQLQATEALITELRVETDVSKTKLGVLEMSNANLLRDQETLKADLELAKAEYIHLENVKEDVRNHAKAVSDELSSLKISQEEQNSTIEGLVDSLTQTSNDALALRENYEMLEASVAGYEAEIRMKEDIRQNLETQVKQNNSRIVQLSADLQNAEKLVEDVRSGLAEANRRAAVAESLNEKLTIESSLKDNAVQQYQDDLATVQKHYADAQLEIMESATKHANETMTFSSTISYLQDDLTTANSDVESLTSRLRVVEDERVSIKEDLGKKGAELVDTLNILEAEHKEKMAFKADLIRYKVKTQELEEELGYFKTSKEADEATISNLRASFMKLRESQQQIFGEFEQKVYI